ncbi:hypothetical protein DSL72_006257 [Monilinia vaccinii-corymbosi]|uniref:Uncharacterized protein n=1 Tax=Monilinia vaccinii-corymbosi TaxID=61207 RepID=A0A8A3PNC1_9HELO|nr:hypothetical protein DSL72_006257 [Monilinia vaccinii-corymbosi]
MPPKTPTTTNRSTPPQTQTQTQPQPSASTDITLLFKHTSHTILLLLTPHQTFTQIQALLLTILQERYPSGLTPMPSSPSQSKIPLPTHSHQISLALPKDAQDPQRGGWTELDNGVGDTPSALGLKDGAILAFRFLRGEEEEEEGADEGERGFEVRWPSYEEMYGEGVGDGDGEEKDLGSEVEGEEDL